MKTVDLKTLGVHYTKGMKEVGAFQVVVEMEDGIFFCTKERNNPEIKRFPVVNATDKDVEYDDNLGEVMPADSRINYRPIMSVVPAKERLDFIRQTELPRAVLAAA